MLIFGILPVLILIWQKIGFIMENKNSNSNDYKHHHDKLENLENGKIQDNYKLHDDDENNFSFDCEEDEENSELRRCKDCKIVRVSKEKFLNHLNSRRHLKIIEMNRKR